MQTNRIYLLNIFLFFVYSCGNQHLKPSEYVAWVEDFDNGCIAQKEVSKYQISVLHKPLEYIISKEFLSGKLNANDIEKRKSELNGLEYFQIRFKSTDKNVRVLDIGNESQQSYFDKVNYFSFGIASDLGLIHNNDTLPCSIHHYVRNYELAPYVDLMLAFPKPITKGKTKLLFDGTALGIGIVLLPINNSDTRSIPFLKLG